jgi:hypothetical protein
LNNEHLPPPSLSSFLLNASYLHGTPLALLLAFRGVRMRYQMIPLIVFLAVLLVGGLALIGDAGLRLLRGQRR